MARGPTMKLSIIIANYNYRDFVGAAIESALAVDWPDKEVIVVDDGSTDGTVAILKDLVSRLPKLRVLAAGELPIGWVGKNRATAVGAPIAKGEWLLFTDADTFHVPGAVRRALADAEEHDAQLVSYSPEQEMERWWERALGLQVFWMLSKRYRFERVNDLALPDAAANGQFILIRRQVYEIVGGHRAIASEVLEDVALARLVKGTGFRLYFASGVGIVQTRMYRSFAAMWEGWTKNLYALVGGSILGLLRALGDWWVVLALIAAAFGTIVNPLNWIVITVGTIWFVARIAAFGRFLRENRYPVSDIQFYVPGVFLYGAAMIASWWKNMRGTVEWKGRRYAPGMTRG